MCQMCRHRNTDLIKLEVPESLAKQVVRMTGGRMILLRQARETFRESKGLSEKEQFDKIKKVLYKR